MIVRHNSLVLVADGAKRLLFRNEGDAQAPHLVVVAAAEQENPAVADQVTDSAGRASSPQGASHGALVGADPREMAEQRFATETVAALESEAETYEQLIVIAPPRTLGELRKHFSKSIEKKIVREINKSVTGHPVGEIEKLLLAQD
jgi:protein required for attachment to host cells